MPKRPTKTKPEAKPEDKAPETREQKLVRLANARVTKACKYISLVGNLAAYKPTDAQIAKIMAALADSCARVENRMTGTRTESISFTMID